MTDTTITAHQNPAPAPTPYNELAELVKKATANPATLEFPTDRWGFTSEIKKAVLKSASTVRGQDDKHDLLIGTLAVLIQHIKLRKDSDKALVAAQRDRYAVAAAERAPRERVTADVAAPITENTNG